MFFLDHIWLIPLFPAIGAVCMFFFGRKLSKSAVSGVCVGVVVWPSRGRASRCGNTPATPPSIPASPSRRCCTPGWAPAITPHHAQMRRAMGPRTKQLAELRDPQRHGRIPRRRRLHARSAVRHLAAVRDRRRHVDPHLLHRLHGARRRLLPLLRLHEPVHVLHADAHSGQQLCPDVRWLGGRRPVLVSAHRLLLPAALRFDRRQQGIHRQPHRRRRIHSRHVHHRVVLRLDAVHQGQPAGAQRTIPHRRSRHHHRRACYSSSARAASRRSSRFTSGCRMRWKVPRQSPRSSTLRPW